MVRTKQPRWVSEYLITSARADPEGALAQFLLGKGVDAQTISLPRGGSKKYLPRPVRDRMHHESPLSDADEALRWTKMVDNFIEATKKRAGSLARRRVYRDPATESAYWEWYGAVEHAIAGVIVVDAPDVSEVRLEPDPHHPAKRWVIVPKGHPAAQMGPLDDSEEAAKKRQRINGFVSYYIAELAEELPDGQTGPRQIRERRRAYARRRSEGDIL